MSDELDQATVLRAVASSYHLHGQEGVAKALLDAATTIEEQRSEIERMRMEIEDYREHIGDAVSALGWDDDE